MNKPVPLGNVTIQVPDNLPPEKKQKYVQAIMQQIRQQKAQEQRDYEMYQKGIKDGRGILGIFGF